MGSILEATILHHVCIILGLLWFLNSYYYCHPVAYFLSLIYLYLVHEGYVMRLTKRLQFEEKRDSNQRRVLSESESVRWLNHAIEKMWTLCMEEIVSQKILRPIVPWFLQKYKPWTVKEIEVQSLYLGRSPPIFTEMRVLQNSNGDDHLVLELGMNFRTADDMSSILAVKLTKRLGFGMWAKLHLLGMHVEGKVLVGVKFKKTWPFISRMRVCFAGPPYFQMTVKPIFTHGLDVTELPGIAGWLDNLLALVFEQTLVEPNMLVVDVEKFVSPQPEDWFTVDAKDPIAFATVEILEGTEMNPSDLNGLADPYVKGQLGPYRFRTKTHKKTLAPKWREEFKVPICTWESQNVLAIEVRDKDHVYDDSMGDCSVNLNDLRDGQRHDIWLPLQNIKMGRLHLAVTVLEVNEKGTEPSENNNTGFPIEDDPTNKRSLSSKSMEKKTQQVADKFEPIDIAGQEKTGIWIHQPGSEVAQVWEPRKGKTKHRDTYGEIKGENGNIKSTEQKSDNSSTDESVEANKTHPLRKGLRKIGSVFQRNRTTDNKTEPNDNPSPRVNIIATNNEKVGVTLIVDDIIGSPNEDEDGSPWAQKPMKDKAKAKGMFQQAKDSARNLKNSFSKKVRKSESELSHTDESGLLCKSSDDELILSPVDVTLAEGGLVIPGKEVSGNSSLRSEDCNVETPRDIGVEHELKVYPAVSATVA